MTDTTTDRVKFANKIVIDGVEAVDLDSLEFASKSTGKGASGNLVSVYKTICEKALEASKSKKAWPVSVPEGASKKSLTNAILTYARKHYDEKFVVKEGKVGGLLYVIVDGMREKKAEKPAEASPPPPN